jgi:heme-degrading monooxygenase HmoA
MIVVVFRSRLREEHAAEYGRVAARIDELAKETPGFLGIKGFTAPDGERVSISCFENEDAVRIWREQPEHREAQRLGREKFYSHYSVEVCRLLHSRQFPG